MFLQIANCLSLSILKHTKKFCSFRVVFSYLVKCDAWNVITPFSKSAGLGSWSVISVQCDVFSSEFINNLTCAFLKEGSAQTFLFAWNEAGIVIVAGSTRWMAGEHDTWRTGPIISLSSDHWCGISWTYKNDKHWFNRPKRNNILSAKVPEVNTFYGRCTRVVLNFLSKKWAVPEMTT